MPKQKQTSVEILSQVKQIVETDLADTANDLLKSGDWVLIGLRKGRCTTNICYIVGRIR